MRRCWLHRRTQFLWGLLLRLASTATPESPSLASWRRSDRNISKLKYCYTHNISARVEEIHLFSNTHMCMCTTVLTSIPVYVRSIYKLLYVMWIALTPHYVQEGRCTKTVMRSFSPEFSHSLDFALPLISQGLPYVCVQLLWLSRPLLALLLSYKTTFLVYVWFSRPSI